MRKAHVWKRGTDVKRTGILFLLAVVIGFSGLAGTAASAAAVDEFSDIENHWGKSAIISAVHKGIVTGYPDGSFKPNANITRAEFIKMLVTAIELPVDESGEEWFAPYVTAAIQAGIHTEADFADYNSLLDRLQLMRLVSRALAMDEKYKEYLDAFEGLYNGDLPYVDYRDLTEEDVPYAALAIGSGILGGYSDATLGLSNHATRAEAVVMIQRLLSIKPKDPETMLPLQELKEVAETGTNAASVSNLIPQIDLSKESAVVETRNYTAKLKRYYVIPTEGDKKSIYERKFLWDRNELPPHFLQRKKGFVVAVTDLTPNKDGNQELFRQNTYLSPNVPFYFEKPSLKFGYIQPYPAEPVRLKKDTTTEVMFYGRYTDEYFYVVFQSSYSISGGWHRLLFNPDKPTPAQP